MQLTATSFDTPHRVLGRHVTFLTSARVSDLTDPEEPSLVTLRPIKFTADWTYHTPAGPSCSERV
jgi:hypothetical protein